MLEDILVHIDGLRTRIQEAWTMLRLDEVKHEIAALEVESSDPGFWHDPDHAKGQLQKLSDLKKDYEAWNTLRIAVIDLDEMTHLAQQDEDVSIQTDIMTRLEELKKEYHEREFALLFSGEHDAGDAIVSIHAGAGGTDAQDWAEMLMRMVFRYAEKKNWSVRLVDESRGTEAGIKSITFFVSGRYAYGHLKSEAGVHRLVRQSPFNSDALRQTSFALIEVVPVLEKDTDVEIDPKDLRVDTFMSGGKGGQSVNTTYSAVRIVHLPTKITVSCQNERSQTQNKEVAMQILKARLQKLKEEELEKEKQKLRGEYQSAEWGNQIRSYVLHPYHMVKDHRTDVETADTDAVLNGELDAFVEGYLRSQTKAVK